MIRLALGHDATGRTVSLAAHFTNRHALVTGATGKGKSNTLAVMAESFSGAGVPSLVLDVKGDLIGLARSAPVCALDPFDAATAARLDLYRLGPDLIGRALDLSDAQGGAVDVAFAFADSTGRRLASLEDLRDVLATMAADYRAISDTIGLVSPSSLAAVQRAALRLSRDAAPAFGRPGFDVSALERRTDDGRGVVSVMACSRLIRTPGLYGALCAFILSDLFDRLPEVGDLAAPRLAVFLDESHLIFEGAAPPLIRRIEQIVRLIRSKGVAVVMATQSPADLPAAIAGQLQNRIQHGLHGVTPADQRAIRAAADTMPVPHGFRAYEAIGSLGVGAALVSLVQSDGSPGVAAVVRINRARAELAPLRSGERASVPPIVPVEPGAFDYAAMRAQMNEMQSLAFKHERPRPKGLWWKAPLAVLACLFLALLLMPMPPG
jgi:DNA helicase HerA-like ATPase